LIFGRFFTGAKKKKDLLTVRGTITAPEGMGQLIKSLERWLSQNGVSIRRGTTAIWNPELPNWKWVIATGAHDAAEILKAHPVHQLLDLIEVSPVVSITAFFNPLDARTKGFGILFPRGEAVRALGVLINNEIFNHRSDVRSETWIYGGATDHDVMNLTDAELMSRLLLDRKTAERGIARPLFYRIQRWPAAIPHYTVELERILERLSDVPNTYLIGNYLGDLGLSRIVERAFKLAEEVTLEPAVETEIKVPTIFSERLTSVQP
jgi:oxygen-dependent protoporphyrinogen oxidase